MKLLPAAVRSVLDQPLPRTVRWWHTLGALLLVYLGVQAITGLLMATYYNPSPENAYASMGYLREELFLGEFVHALHREGAGFVLVVAALHLLHVFFTAAYKRGRASLWWISLLGFGLLTMFPFTGMLLPLDQKGYWATVIGLDVAGGSPMVGELVRDLLTGGGDATSPIAMSRFYLLHVCVLPITLLALVFAYVRTLLCLGPPEPPEGTPAPCAPFFPVQTARIVIVALVGLGVLALLASLSGSPTISPADPADETFFPYPEWYFLPHYQTLRMLPGSWQWVGTIYVPVLFLILLALPLVDRGTSGPIRRRVLQGAGIAGVVTALGLGTAAAVHVQANRTDRGGEEPETPAGEVDAVAAGKAVYEEFQCMSCHVLQGEGEAYGPELTGIARRVRDDFLDPFLRNPSDFFTEAEMQPWDGTDEELANLIAFLLTK